MKQKINVPDSLRIIGVAVAVAILVGLLVVFLLLLGNGQKLSGFFESDFSSLLELYGIALVTAMPISVPMGLVGGILAAWALKKKMIKQGATSWIGQGCLWGIILGSLGTVLWFGGINFGSSFQDSGLLLVLSFMTPIGAVSGGIIGVIVGAYCKVVENHKRLSWKFYFLLLLFLPFFPLPFSLIKSSPTHETVYDSSTPYPKLSVQDVLDPDSEYNRRNKLSPSSVRLLKGDSQK